MTGITPEIARKRAELVDKALGREPKEELVLGIVTIRVMEECLRKHSKWRSDATNSEAHDLVMNMLLSMASHSGKTLVVRYD